MFDHIVYYLIRLLTLPCAYLPYKTIHAIGKKIGTLAYFLLPKFRKRALSNLALATKLNLNNSQIISMAKSSMQNLAIVLLEYAKLANTHSVNEIVEGCNLEPVLKLREKNQGIIFFCGHQSNWELLFLYGTNFMPGIAIGRPIKNQKLYNWILKIRQKNGGKIITPKNALKEGLKGLKKGKFLGIVGDQGMPESPYCFPFLGRRGWSSSAPAILAYKANAPIIVASTERRSSKYRITFSDPIWPNLNASLEEEVKRLMDETFRLFEKTVIEKPEEWLWQHNRWKQQLPHALKRSFRKESIAILLPDNDQEFLSLLPHLPTLKTIYPREFLYIFISPKHKNMLNIEAEEVFCYHNEEELLKNDFRFKLILDFTSCSKVKKHYLQLAASDVYSLKDLQKIAKTNNLSETFQYAFLKNRGQYAK